LVSGNVLSHKMCEALLGICDFDRSTICTRQRLSRPTLGPICDRIEHRPRRLSEERQVRPDDKGVFHANRGDFLAQLWRPRIAHNIGQLVPRHRPDFSDDLGE
jgi:hypothetical protein